MKILKAAGAIAFALIGLCSTSHAAVAVGFTGQTASGITDAPFRYNYSLSITAGDTFSSGDFVTLYDLTGLSLAAGSIVTTPGTFTTQSLYSGITPTLPNDPTIFVADNPGILNLTFRYTGATISNPIGSQNPLNFATISFASSQGRLSTVRTYAATSSTLGFDADNAGNTIGPSAVPEPSVMAMVGLGGLVGLAYKKMHGSRRKV